MAGRPSQRKSRPSGGFDDLVPSKASGSRPSSRASATGQLPKGRPSQKRNGAEAENAASDPKQKPVYVADGPFGNGSETFGRYQNMSNCAHMLSQLVRLSSGTSAHTVDWHLNLRGGAGRKPEEGWRRYFTRAQPSFDALKENCSPDNKAYQMMPSTPVDNKFDRNAGAIKIATIREDDGTNFHRAKGCEGSQAGQWQFLQKPGVTRAQLRHHTTLRESPGEAEGASINDNRSDACWVEMLGKKQWNGAGVRNYRDPLALPPCEGGDAKLHHLYYMKVQLENNESIRNTRLKKTPRRDAEACRRTPTPTPRLKKAEEEV
ncbi:unnamed protein product [Polarella glacialis]|uniref:Uncharacterized protein n=1 Tax=Polarella glacialis TaxID=89957 RepID=A0A813KY93_POLGL|nr:unnamed protein product [Polarella glacialis]|eukprot:CAMPEP_0115070704 /NCGR_PEP_ID=MMETSP0227-20121206/13269_1 /TAXON_ID=89957 /ORGANISM="Polarella glacialis, Strain CCMP 1383" /LENGTH=318 /DNA_ID=CAMNT_0002457263 /DNA_START=44 /DNA_END=1000 /DNA_ORIENTATION=+